MLMRATLTEMQNFPAHLQIRETSSDGHFIIWRDYMGLRQTLSLLVDRHIAPPGEDWMATASSTRHLMSTASSSSGLRTTASSTSFFMSTTSSTRTLMMSTTSSSTGLMMSSASSSSTHRVTIAPSIRDPMMGTASFTNLLVGTASSSGGLMNASSSASPSSSHQTKRFMRYGCGFCRKNSESPEIYLSHKLKSRDGRVLCPILRRYVCPFCSATGDWAHTRLYCPLRRADDQ